MVRNLATLIDDKSFLVPSSDSELNAGDYAENIKRFTFNELNSKNAQ